MENPPGRSGSTDVEAAARAAGVAAFLVDWCAVSPGTWEDGERLYHAYRVCCAIEMRFIASRQAFLDRLTHPPYGASVIGSEVLGLRLVPAFEAYVASFVEE